VSLPQAVESAGEALGQGRLTRACRRVAAGAKEGGKLSELLAEEDIFPESLIWTVAQGERLGTLERGLARLALRFERARENHLDPSIRFIEVIILATLMVSLGLLIAGFYQSVFGFTLAV